MARERFVPAREGAANSNDSPFLPRGARRQAGKFQRLDAASLSHMSEQSPTAAANDPGPGRSTASAANGAPAANGPQKSSDGPLPLADADELGQIFAQAQEEGYARGLEEGRTAGQAQFNQALTALTQSAQEVLDLRNTLTSVYRRELSELALHIGSALVLRELANGPQTVQNMVDQALHALDSHEAMQLHLSAHDHPQIESWLTHVGQKYPGLQVVVDPNFGPGDLRLQAKSGNVSMMLNERLHAVRRLVLGEEPDSTTSTPTGGKKP